MSPAIRFPHRTLVLTCVAAFSVALVGCDKIDQEVVRIKERAAAKITEVRPDLPPLAIWPPSSAGEYLAARIAIGNDDLATANKAFQQAIATAPSEQVAIYLAERALPAAIGEGDLKSATAMSAHIDDVKRTASGQFAVLLRLRADFEKANWAQAQTDLADLRADGFNQYITPLTKVWILAGQKKYSQALTELDKAGQANPSFRSLFALHRAFLLDQSNQTLQAEKAYTDVVKQYFSLRNALAAADFFKRQHNENAVRQIHDRMKAELPVPLAIETLSDTLSDDMAVGNATQGFANILFDLATVLQQENSSRLALLYARLAEGILPEQPMFDVLMGDIFSDMKRYDQARGFYDAIGADNLFYPVAQLRIADNYALNGDIDAALKALEPLSKQTGLRRQVLMQMGDLLRADKQFARAIPYYTQIIDELKEPKKDDWALYYARGICYESNKDWAKAEADLQQALKLNPEQPEVLNYLGYSWADQGVKLDEAFEYVSRAHAQTPEDPYILDSMGWVLYALGHFKEAVPYLEEAVQMLPADPVINDHLGDVYWQVGRDQEARFQWERALKNDDTDDGKLAARLKDKIHDGMARKTASTRKMPEVKEPVPFETMLQTVPKKRAKTDAPSTETPQKLR